MKRAGNKLQYSKFLIIVLSTIFLAPFVLLVSGLWDANFSVLRTIVSTVFSVYIINTVLITIFVILGTIIIGASTAWLTSQYEFPFRSLLYFFLPLSVIISPFMRALIFYEYANKFSALIIPPIRSVSPIISGYIINWINFPFLVVTLVFSFYPYVFFFVSASYSKNSRSIIEAAKLLNTKKKPLFLSIGLPIAKTAILISSVLVGIEILNEYAAMVYFGYNTVSSGIYRTWFLYGDLNSAKVLALGVLVIVLVIVFYTRKSVQSIRYDSYNYLPCFREKLSKKRGILATIYCVVLIGIGFILPLIHFSYWAYITVKSHIQYDLIVLVRNTLLLIIVATVFATIFAIGISFINSIKQNRTNTFVYRILSMGYAVPGTVMAIAILGFFYFLDTYLIDNVAVLFIGKSIIALVFAMLLRFFFVAAEPIYMGFHSYGRRYTMAASTLGSNAYKNFFKISLPLNIPFIVSGILLFIVEILKEIPMTLALRPFNFDTLSIKTYLLAQDEMLIESSLPTLITIGIGVVCMGVFSIGRWKFQKQ